VHTYKIYVHIYNVIGRKQIAQLKCAKYFNRHLSKVDIQIVHQAYESIFYVPNHQGNSNENNDLKPHTC
jgi:beta-galactosidase beta subunit